jgi:hypothetical protein
MQEENNIPDSQRDQTFLLGISESEALTRCSRPPFEAVIEHMRQLAKYRTPIEKMRVFAQCNALIFKAIDQFWRGVEGVKPKDLVIDAD